MIVLIVLVLLKFGLRFGLKAGALHLNAVLLTDISICFSAMLFAVSGLEIFLRAQRIMGERAGAA